MWRGTFVINVHMLAADFRLIRHKVSTCSVRVGLVGVCGGGGGGEGVLGLAGLPFVGPHTVKRSTDG